MDTVIRIHNVYDKNCPTRQVLDRIADKYTVLVIIFVQDRPRRFSELQRMITGISQKVLTQTLRSLERDGLLTRTVYPEVPPRRVCAYAFRGHADRAVGGAAGVGGGSH